MFSSQDIVVGAGTRGLAVRVPLWSQMLLGCREACCSWCVGILGAFRKCVCVPHCCTRIGKGQQCPELYLQRHSAAVGGTEWPDEISSCPERNWHGLCLVGVRGARLGCPEPPSGRGRFGGFVWSLGGDLSLVTEWSPNLAIGASVHAAWNPWLVFLDWST